MDCWWVARSFYIGFSSSKHIGRGMEVGDTWDWSIYPEVIPEVTPEVAGCEFRPRYFALRASSWPSCLPVFPLGTLRDLPGFPTIPGISCLSGSTFTVFTTAYDLSYCPLSPGLWWFHGCQVLESNVCRRFFVETGSTVKTRVFFRQNHKEYPELVPGMLSFFLHTCGSSSQKSGTLLPSDPHPTHTDSHGS